MTDQDAWILPFADIRATDLPLVGGKGANLGEMTHFGFPVPPGFCLTTDAFHHFLSAYPRLDELYALLDGVRLDDLAGARAAGRRVRETLLTVPVPPDIQAAVARAWRGIGTDRAYAVRSSATAEDLPDASFAGQQDTYLNVLDEAALIDAVRRCWVSLFTDRAILYRIRSGFDHRGVGLSVIVQQMIDSDVSGTLFTADPLSGHRHTVAIDAGFGLGEALVGGLVSPDAFRVDTRSRSIVDRRIADKQVAIVPRADGGVDKVALDDTRRAATALTDEQILALADLGRSVEAHYGAPQDIEWAIQDGRIHLLQARPITSLFPIDGLVSPDDSLHVFFSMGHQQNMTRAMSPMGMSVVRCLVPIGKEHGETESRLVRSNAGRMFADITQALRHPRLRKVLMGVLSQFDGLAPEALDKASRRPEFQRPHQIRASFAQRRAIARVALRVLAAVGWQDLSDRYRVADERIALHLRDVRARLAGAEPGEAAVGAVIAELGRLLPVALVWLPQFAAGALAQRLIPRLAGSWADPHDLDAYDLGLPGNAVTEMNLALGDVADVARRAPAVVALLAELGADSRSWLAEAERAEGSGPFMVAWRDFLTEYGARGSAEIDIATPRWYEEPLPLLKVIAKHVEQEPGSHRAQHEALAEARRGAVARLVSGANHGPGGRLRARIMRRLIHVSHEGGVLREHHKFLAVQVFRLLKEALEETAPRLVADGKLQQTADVWFLSLPELLALCRGQGADTVAQIPARRQDILRFDTLTPPMVITSDGEIPTVEHHVADAPPGALVGAAVSGGVVEGLVHVIRDPLTETLAPGEILVAPFTDPGWTPLFINAGGLILEIGGIMTHGSVVAREYGIPAVVGVRGATERLQTGQRVRIDGNRGVIEVL